MSAAPVTELLGQGRETEQRQSSCSCDHRLDKAFPVCMPFVRCGRAVPGRSSSFAPSPRPQGVVADRSALAGDARESMSAAFRAAVGIPLGVMPRAETRTFLSQTMMTLSGWRCLAHVLIGILLLLVVDGHAEVDSEVSGRGEKWTALGHWTTGFRPLMDGEFFFFF